MHIVILFGNNIVMSNDKRQKQRQLEIVVQYSRRTVDGSPAAWKRTAGSHGFR
jgi:hypothetical protein